MRYGLPYHGSKNAIAEWVINELPGAPCFADLFGGGGAITHRAVLSGKYKSFIYNDFNPLISAFFKECIEGKHTAETHPDFISRAEFHRLKDADGYVSLCWSFGNDGKTYIYGEEIEAMKEAYHKAVFKGFLEPLRAKGVNIQEPLPKSPKGRYMSLKAQLKQQLPEGEERLLHFERLQRLEEVQTLGRCGDALKICNADYGDIKTPPGALIYCDIPYNNTKCGIYEGFDHNRFYEWAERQDNIFISEYNMPPEFIEVANIEKEILSASKSIEQKATEKIFTNKRTFDKMNDNQKMRAHLKNAKQLTLFDYMEGTNDT